MAPLMPLPFTVFSKSSFTSLKYAKKILALHSHHLHVKVHKLFVFPQTLTPSQKNAEYSTTLWVILQTEKQANRATNPSKYITWFPQTQTHKHTDSKRGTDIDTILVCTMHSSLSSLVIRSGLNQTRRPVRCFASHVWPDSSMLIPPANDTGSKLSAHHNE